MTSCQKVVLTEDKFGEIKDENGQVVAIRRFTWSNSNGVKVQLITYGGYVTSIQVPDKNGKVEDVCIGFSDIEGYLKPENAYFGATVGRVANRIKKGEMVVEGVKYSLATNNGPNHLHGGIKGFDKVIWNGRISGTKVVLSYLSKEKEEGYPGNLLVNVTFELTQENEFTFDYQAVADKVTPVNLANHAYFNLAGHDKGSAELYNHVFTINADKITEVGGDGMPTGQLLNVSGTVFDLRVPTRVGDVVRKVPNSPGFDHNFCVTRASKQGESFVAKVRHPGSGRVLEVYSDQPGVQFYTGNFLPDDKSLKGKNALIEKHGAFCLETQKYPDAVNIKQFDSPLLYPGEQYHHRSVYKFFVEK